MIYMLMSDYHNLGNENWPDEWYYDEFFQSGDIVIANNKNFLVLKKFEGEFEMLSTFNKITKQKVQGIFGPLYTVL